MPVIAIPGQFDITDYGAQTGGAFDNQPAITDAMLAAEAAGGVVVVPAGDFGVDTPVVFRAPITGLGVDSSRISANTGFTGVAVLDADHTAERKFIRDLALSGGNETACLASSDDALGSSSALFENVFFVDTPPGVYAVGGSSVSVGAGMLTGATFLRCSWDGCAQPLNIGSNQDDVTLISCRTNMNSVDPATDYQIRCTGQNTRFIGCYFGLGDTDQDFFGIVPFFSIGSSTVSVESCFFEAHDGTNLTHLFGLLNPSAHLSVRNLVVRNFATSPRTTTLAHIFYTNIESSTAANTYLDLENLDYEGDAPLTSALSAFVQTGVSGKFKSFRFAGIDDVPAVWTKGSGSSTGAVVNFLHLDGVHRGQDYRGFVAQDGNGDLLNVDAGWDTARSVTVTASGASPQSDTVTLPGPGVYLLSAAAKLNGSADHAMSGVWLVFYADETNDTLSTQALGAVVKSAGSTFGLGTLTASNPSSAGVVTLAATWTDGLSHTAIWTGRARLLAPFAN